MSDEGGGSFRKVGDASNNSGSSSGGGSSSSSSNRSSTMMIFTYASLQLQPAAAHDIRKLARD